MKISDLKKVYCIGIKGAGMTAIAQILRERNIKISGSDIGDVFYTDELLRRLCIPFHEEFAAKHVSEDSDLIIYSTAYNEENNVEMAEAKRLKVTMVSYPEMLGMLFQEKLGIAVCGTHGKTTTSAMLADVLLSVGLDPSAIVGSQVISWQGSALTGAGDYFVAEADEYQNKLIYYNPWSVILTSVNWDHPDFFSDFVVYKKVFEDFVEKIHKTGFLIVWGDSIDTLEVANKATCKKVTYGFNEECDYRISNFQFPISKQIQNSIRQPAEQIQNEMQSFEIFHKEKSLGFFETALIGKHNVLNAAAVIAMCHAMQLDMEKIGNALREFKGTSRRFEQVGMFRESLLIDDYAHHPDEIKATLEGARQHFGEKTIWTIFHPHTFTRTKALLQEFAQSFDNTDKAIVIDIYGSAREHHGGVSSADLVNLINKYFPGKAEYIPTIDEAVEYCKEKSGQYDVLITMGAGDVWKVGEKLKKA